MEFARFETIEGYGVVIDLNAVSSCWQAKTPDCIVFILYGVEDTIEVVGDFENFLHDFVTYYDCRKKPRRTKKTRRGKATAVSG